MRERRGRIARPRSAGIAQCDHDDRHRNESHHYDHRAERDRSRRSPAPWVNRRRVGREENVLMRAGISVPAVRSGAVGFRCQCARCELIGAQPLLAGWRRERAVQRVGWNEQRRGDALRSVRPGFDALATGMLLGS